MWCLPESDGTVRVGITSFGVKLSGHFFFCRPKPVGWVVAQGETVAIAELNKSVVAIRSPLGGTVVEGNALLAERPELIEHDPYGQGWLVRIAPSRWDEDLRQLAHGDALAQAMEARMRLEPLEDGNG